MSDADCIPGREPRSVAASFPSYPPDIIIAQTMSTVGDGSRTIKLYNLLCTMCPKTWTH